MPQKIKGLPVVGGLVGMICFLGFTCLASPENAPSRIVLITIDTLRADHLSCYGYHRKTTPYIDSLAAQGIVYRNVCAPSSWTAPSMASLFTSTYPINHGVIHGFGYKAGKTVTEQEVFSPELVTLTEALLAQGYTTFGVASNFHLSEKFGFERGFDYFSCLPFLPADKVNETVFAWEEDIKKAGKYFLWVHYIDPHVPYTAHEPWIRHYAAEAGTLALLNQQWRSMDEWAEQMQRVQENTNAQDHFLALYDSEINYVDAHIGMLIERLQLDSDALVIVTSDHGEEFKEHGKDGHGHNLYQETVRVPLVIKPSGYGQGAVSDRFLNLIDLMPTVLQMMHIAPPAEISGKSFWKEKSPLIWLKERVAGSDIGYSYAELDTAKNLKAVFSPPWKYIHDFRNNTGELYNITTDSGELSDVAGEQAGVCNKLKGQLFRWMETAKRYPTTKYADSISPELKEQLKGLGYL